MRQAGESTYLLRHAFACVPWPGAPQGAKSNTRRRRVARPERANARIRFVDIVICPVSSVECGLSWCRVWLYLQFAICFSNGVALRSPLQVHHATRHTTDTQSQITGVPGAQTTQSAIEF